MKRRCSNCKTEYDGNKCPKCGSTIGENLQETYFGKAEGDYKGGDGSN